MIKLLCTLTICLAFAGCAQITPYRTVMPGQTEPLCRSKAGDSAQCAQDSYFLLATQDGAAARDTPNPIPIGIVEFDDQGVLQSRAAKDAILERIRALNKTTGTLVVAFAHGWLNNAAPGNDNLAEFQKMLVEIAADDESICKGESCEGRQVVGVYLGWRGESATLQPFKALSFWNRKTRAERIGQDGATELVGDLAKLRSTKPPGQEESQSRLILMGHSFGGALLYSATQQLLMKDATGAESRSVPRTVANLLILVNPAFEAARFTALHDRSQTMDFPVTQRPILAIFTSRTDLATKLAFPAGRILSSLFTAYNPNQPEQAAMDRTAIGHYAAYQTHELRLGAGQDFARLNEAVCNWERFAAGADDWNLGRVVLARNQRLKELGKERLRTPYYNVAVDGAVIAGHSGIWSPEFVNFIPLFLAAQERDFKTVQGQRKPEITCAAP